MNILLIEDEPVVRDTLRDVLELHGHSVVTANDGPEGVARAHAHPDLILCDVSLPGLDGYQVLNAIRHLPGLPPPFIILSGHAARQDQHDGLDPGADAFLTKPFTERQLLDAIAACFPPPDHPATPTSPVGN